jgi:hypothetical protein
VREKLRLKVFCAENYRSIGDSGSIPVGDLTALVGVNEAGEVRATPWAFQTQTVEDLFPADLYAAAASAAIGQNVALTAVAQKLATSWGSGAKVPDEVLDKVSQLFQEIARGIAMPEAAG